MAILTAQFVHGRWSAGRVAVPVRGVSGTSTTETAWFDVIVDDDSGEIRAGARVRPSRGVPPDLGAVMTRAIRDPYDGRPHLPAIVRVATTELADEVRRARPEVRLEIGPTANLVEVAHDLADDFVAEPDWRWLAGEVPPSPEAVAALFHAAPGFLAATPWDILEPGLFVRVALPRLGLREVFVTLQADMAPTGLLLTVAIAPSATALDAWMADEVPADEIDIQFLTRDELPEAAWAEASAHGWGAGADTLFPKVIAGGESMRAPSPRELGLATSVLDALTRFLALEDVKPDPEGIVSAEVTLAGGDLARVRIDPMDRLEGDGDEDDGDEDAESEGGDEGEDADAFAGDVLDPETEQDLAFLEEDDKRAWPAAPAPTQATIRVAAKPGRNDVCWCGSGKKYKKCHLDEDATKNALT